MIPGQQVDQFVLHPIRILIFVDQDVLPAALVEFEYAGKSLEEFDDLEQDVAEIECVRVHEHLLVEAVDPRVEFAIDVIGLFGSLGGQHARILPLIDAPANSLGIVRFRIQALPLERLLDQAQAVGIIVDHEAATPSQVADIPAQNPNADIMEGPDCDFPQLGSQDFRDTLLHFARRLIGKGDGEQGLGGNSTGSDQVGDAAGENPRFAAPRPGKHQQRPLRILHGVPLFVIQTLDDGIAEQCMPPAMRNTGMWEIGMTCWRGLETRWGLLQIIRVGPRLQIQGEKRPSPNLGNPAGEPRHGSSRRRNPRHP